MKKILVTWDIPEEENSDGWTVQFWMVEEGKPTVLVGEVNKDCGNLGTFTIPLHSSQP